MQWHTGIAGSTEAAISPTVQTNHATIFNARLVSSTTIPERPGAHRQHHRHHF